MLRIFSLAQIATDLISITLYTSHPVQVYQPPGKVEHSAAYGTNSNANATAAAAVARLAGWLAGTYGEWL